MANQYDISNEQLKIIKDQAKRRAELRKEFLKQTTNPAKHGAQAGYLFDSALQRFLSMKVSRYEHFQPNPRTTLFGLGVVVLPITLYAYLMNKQRTDLERRIRNGEIKYKDRAFKLI